MIVIVDGVFVLNRGKIWGCPEGSFHGWGDTINETLFSIISINPFLFLGGRVF